jgi:hypothetical protein
MFFKDRRHFLLDKATDNPPPGDPTNDPADPPNDPPPSDEVTKLRNQLEAEKKMRIAESKKRQELQDSLKAKDMEKLKENERWKEIAEMKEKEAKEEREKSEKVTKAVQNDKKYSAIKLAAQQAGIRKEALDDLELIDFPEVTIETNDAGNTVVQGVKSAIDALKLKRPHWFGKGSGNINSSLPETTTSGKVTVAQVLAAEKKWRQSQSAEDFKEYARLNKALSTQR